MTHVDCREITCTIEKWCEEKVGSHYSSQQQYGNVDATTYQRSTNEKTHRYNTILYASLPTLSCICYNGMYTHRHIYIYIYIYCDRDSCITSGMFYYWQSFPCKCWFRFKAMACFFATYNQQFYFFSSLLILILWIHVTFILYSLFCEHAKSVIALLATCL